MIGRDIYPLAWTLQAQLPDLRIRDTAGDHVTQGHTVRGGDRRNRGPGEGEVCRRDGRLYNGLRG